MREPVATFWKEGFDGLGLNAKAGKAGAGRWMPEVREYVHAPAAAQTTTERPLASFVTPLVLAKRPESATALLTEAGSHQVSA